MSSYFDLVHAPIKDNIDIYCSTVHCGELDAGNTSFNALTAVTGTFQHLNIGSTGITGAEPISIYRELSQSYNWFGPTGSSFSSSILTSVQVGNMVILNLPEVTGTLATGSSYAATTVPVQIVPPGDMWWAARALFGGVVIKINIYLNKLSGGLISYDGLPGTPGPITLFPTSVCYNLL